MSVLKDKLNETFNSIAKHLSAVEKSIRGKVSVENFNNSTREINNKIGTVETTVDGVKNLKGLKLEVIQNENKIKLVNERSELISEIDVYFLNSSGLTFEYDDAKKALILKNKQGQIISEIPIASLVSNLPKKFAFKTDEKHKLELLTGSNEVISTVEITKDNIKDFDSITNAKSLYKSDGTITEERTVTLVDKLKFIKGGEITVIDDSGVTSGGINTNKFGTTHKKEIIKTELNNNRPKLTLGNSDVSETEFLGGNLKIVGLPMKTSQDKVLCIDASGNVAISQGIGQTYTAGTGIKIENGVISVDPQDEINLGFEW